MVVVLFRKCIITKFVPLRLAVILDDPVPDFFKKEARKQNAPEDEEMGAKEGEVCGGTREISIPAAANLTELIEQPDLWKCVMERMGGDETAAAAKVDATERYVSTPNFLLCLSFVRTTTNYLLASLAGAGPTLRRRKETASKGRRMTPTTIH